MDHARIVTVGDLHRFADMQKSREVLPELVKQLLSVSCTPRECRIPGIDDTNQPGLDGFVVAEAGYAHFVPEGESWWEASNEKAVQKKASKDITERAKMPVEAKARSTFVFVTFRPWSESSQRRWKKDREGLGFRDIRVLDATQLADWLAEVPAVARWLLVTMGEVGRASALRSVNEHWLEVQSGRTPPDPSVPPQLFLVGRKAAADAVAELFEGKRSFVWLGVENGRDAQDFIAAVVASQGEEARSLWSSRCMFIDGTDEWAAMTRLRTRHVLVAGETLDLEEREDLRRQALQAGHGIVVPRRSGASSESLVQLRHPTARQVEDALTQAGWPRPRVQQLLADGFSSLSVLKRRIAGEPDVPVYARWNTKRELALACLLGGWQETDGQDLDVVAEVLGAPFDEWRGKVTAQLPEPGSPLIVRDRRWRMIARGESWHALGPALHDPDLRRFETAALRVLGEADPAIDLPKEERWMASVHGRRRSFTQALRKGMAETLALLGSRSSALSAASVGHAENVASSVVRSLLRGAEWTRWMSLHDLMPLLAEAAPNEFLSALEDHLSDPPSSPFPKLFEQEGTAPTGWNYVTGVLWGLETLAWHRSYFARVIASLAALASIDPGGRWANRPANSLTTILLPWHPQTTAPSKARVAAIKLAAKKHEEVAWKLVTSLLPQFGGMTSGSHKPAWRSDLIDEWHEGVTHAFYFEQVAAYLTLAVELSAEHPPRLAELFGWLPEMPAEHRAILLDQIVPVLRGKPEATVLPVWEALSNLAARHRAFPDAAWVMPEDDIAKVEAAAAAVEPSDPALRYRRLFGGVDSIEVERANLGYQEIERRMIEKRAAALTEILAGGGLDRVLGMIAEVKEPRILGDSLGRLDRHDDGAHVLPKLLEEGSEPEKVFAAAFVWGRWQKASWEWVEALPMASWTTHQKALLFAHLPFGSDVWQHAEVLLGSDVTEYWRIVSPWPWGNGEHEGAAELFLRHGRPLAALSYYGTAARLGKSMRHEVAMRVLQACLEPPESSDRFDPGAAQEVFGWLQEQEGVDQKALSKLEWAYIGVLDRLHGPGPKALEAMMASDPVLFCEAIRLVYRADNEPEEASDERSENERRAGEAASRLLRGMEALPGRTSTDIFDASEFESWLGEVRRIANETGHLVGAMIQIGQMIGRAAAARDWMTAMPALAEALDAEDAEYMRRNFRSQLYNNRGVFSPSGGREELVLSEHYRTQSDYAEEQGWLHVATTLRGLAKNYEHEAEWSRRRDDEGLE
ncbi:MAG: hypothetical protein AB7O84_09485 [Planctomycetota bacterium]